MFVFLVKIDFYRVETGGNVEPYCEARSFRFVTTKVARHDGGNYIVSSENQYPVFRGSAEEAEFDGIPGEAGQVAHFQFQDKGLAVTFNGVFA